MQIQEQEHNPIFEVNRDNTSSNKRSLKRKIPLKTYQVTNDEQRFKLIHKVIGEQQLTIREAAAAIGIRYSTAKTILKVFKSEGRIEKKKKRNKRVFEEDECESLQGHIDFDTNLLHINMFDKFNIPKVNPILLKNYKFSTNLPDGFWAARIAAHTFTEDSTPTS